MGNARRRYKERPRRSLLTLGFAIGVLLTGIVLLADVHWLLELFSHYRPHIAVMGVALSLGAVFRKRHFLALGALILSGYHALVLWGYWNPTELTAADPAQRVRVVTLNLSESNRRIDLVSAMIDREKPTLIGVSEISRVELATLGSAIGNYHQAVNTDVAGFGVALFSRVPIQRARTVMLGDQPFPAMVVDLRLGDTPARVIVTHPPPPINQAWASAHRAQFDALNRLIREDRTKEVIVLGDLNATPWSPGFARLLKGTSLRSASLGFPYRPTWPSWAGLLGIPIDHALVGPRFAVNAYRTGPGIGSDHIPIVVDLVPRAE